MGRYIFQPYQTNSKIDCPHCGGKKCYTLYLDTDNGELMPAEFGRCDRENSCGYLRYPSFGEAKIYQANPIIRVEQKYIDKEFIKGCMIWYDKNPFTKCLIEKFGERAREVMQSYYIGTTKAKGTIFWTINHYMIACSGKVITYIGEDVVNESGEEKLAPYRDKEKFPYYPFKKEVGYFPCFFGQHLIKKDSQLWIVESEKTAILCALKWPEFTWISGGGAGGASSSKIKVLRDSGFDGVVNIMPDADNAGRESSGRWVTNFDSYGYRCIVHDLGLEYNEGQDWGDFILKEKRDENNISGH